MSRAFFDGIYRGRWIIVVATLAIAAALVPYLDDIRFDSSSQGSVPRNDPNQAYFNDIKSDFGNDQVAMVVLLSHDELGVFNFGTLTKITELTDTIAALEGVDNVVSLTNSTFLSGMGGEELTNDLIIPGIPADAEAARNLRRDVLANRIFHKSLVSEDGSAASINVFLANQPDSLLLASGLDDKINGLVAEAWGPEEVYYAGLIHTRMEINKTMHRDLGRFVPMSFVLILVILLVAFRSLPGVLIPALTILIALVWTFGLIGLLGISISLTTTIIPPLLIALASSMTIHIISAYRAHAANTTDKREVVVGAFSELSSPLITAALTTAVGFGSLIISPIPNTQKVGIFAVVGILFAIWVSFTFAPAVLSILPLPKSRQARPAGDGFMARLLESLIRFNLHRRVLILTVAGVVLVLSVVGMMRIKVDTDFLSYFKEDSDVRRSADIIGENLAGVSTFYVIASADSTDVMREGDVLQGIEKLQRYMEAQPSIDKATSMVNIIQLWHQAMSADHPDSFKVPASQSDLDAAVFLTVDQEEPRVRAHYVVEDYSSMSVFARSQLVSTTELAETLADVETYARQVLPPFVEVQATGTVVIFAKMIDAVINGQRNSLLLAFGLIFVIMAFLFRSVRVGLISMISNIVPIFVIFGIMGWFGIALNLGTSIVASISLGIAVDDTIHYLMNYRRALSEGKSRPDASATALRHVGQPVIFTSLALALGFSVICFSNFGMLFAVGLLSAITMITCLISDLFLTTALTLTFDFSKNLKTPSSSDGSSPKTEGLP